MTNAHIVCFNPSSKCIAGSGCRFFEDYKKNENKEVKVDEILGAVEARKAIKESMVSLLNLGQ